MEEAVLVNRIAEKGIITIRLDDFYPESEMVELDLKDFMYEGLIVREKEFRQALKDKDWTIYDGKIVLVNCSTDAIIPVWVYLLIENQLAEVAADTYEGTEEEYLRMYYTKKIEAMDPIKYKDKVVVIKGCTNKPVPTYAYAKITKHLKPFVRSLLFGESCSTVPVYKRK